MSRKEYFAYGSNLNFEQMAYRCPEATVVGTAKLDGYELAFRRGYLTILPKEGASVEGLIWSVTDHDESQLDCYEGYPTFYDKETMTVTDADGTPHEIMASHIPFIRRSSARSSCTVTPILNSNCRTDKLCKGKAMSNMRIIEIPASMRESAGQKNTVRKLRVAAYCRVSTEEEEQQGSFEIQKLYYTEKINSTPEWEVAGIYADDGISGVHTKKRDGFNQMIQDCKKRKIEIKTAELIQFDFSSAATF